ncbi:MAG: putative toxin-antitoxin system toxin component, PIN family [Saprospiraceae bacterium]
MSTNKLRIVLDTNVFLVAIPEKSPYHLIYKSFRAHAFDLFVSTEILMEYEEVFAEKLGYERTALMLPELLNLHSIHLTTTYFKWNLIPEDPDDNKFVDCAIAANADYIVTNDRHFNILKQIKFPVVVTIKASEFLELLPAL